jgi:hypothetical protein
MILPNNAENAKIPNKSKMPKLCRNFAETFQGALPKKS